MKGRRDVYERMTEENMPFVVFELSDAVAITT
jgi:hypothetical protein